MPSKKAQRRARIVYSTVSLSLLLAVAGVAFSSASTGASEEADIEVTATGPAALGVGAQGAFLVTVVNKGPDDAAAVRLVPASSDSFTGYENVGATQGTCGPDECQLGLMAAGDTAYVAYCLTATQEGTGSQTFIGTFLIDSIGDTDPPNGAGPPDDIRGNNDAVVSVAISPGGPNPGCSNSLPKPPPGPGQDSCKGKTPTIIAIGPKTVGTDGDDVIAGFGNKKNESIRGKDGNDIICGGKKNDGFIDGGKGNDKLYGKDKKDSLHGGKGNDLVDGGESRDVLHGDQGKDTCIGDKQIDFIVNTCEEIKNK